MEYVTLSNGIKMPILGFGVFRVPDKKECQESVYQAIKAGYRLIDTAASYTNEDAVGKAVKQAIDEGICKREDLFITSKLWVQDMKDYDAAKNDQAVIEGKIQKIEKMLENVEIIKEKATGKVGLGNTVEIMYVDDKDKDMYKIVGSQEADPFMSKISNESPIARAIMNKRVGDIVEVDSPNGKYKIEITEIK